MLEVEIQMSDETLAVFAAQNSRDGLVVTDQTGVVVWANSAYYEMTGLTPEQIEKQNVGLLRSGQNTEPEALDTISRAFAERRSAKTDILAYDAKERAYWVRVTLDPIFNESGQHTHFVAIKHKIPEPAAVAHSARPISEDEEARQFERKLLAQTSEWLYSAKSVEELLSVTQRAIGVMMPEVNGYLMTYANDRETLELTASWGEGPHPQHMTADDCWSLRRGRPYQYGRGLIEVPCAHVEDDTSPYFCLPLVADGETIGLLHLSFPAIPALEAAAGAYNQMLDSRWEVACICAEQISLAIANVRLRMELHDQTVRDQLTGLWNRRWFLDSARKELTRCQAAGQSFGLISIDVDHFKRFNDQYGHDAGDAVLRTVSKLLFRMFPTPFAPCRLGGEEFVVICPNMDSDACYEAAEGFREAMEQAVLRHAGRDLPPITTSQGIAVSDKEHPLDLLDQLKLSDNALYAAKSEGRNRTVLHSTTSEPIIWGEATGT